MEEKKFSYWKKHWNKWLVLGLALLWVGILLFNMGNYAEALGSSMELAEEELEAALQLPSQFSLNLVIVVVLSGLFCIGQFAKSSKAARLSESVMMLCVAVILLAMLIYRHSYINSLEKLIVMMGISLLFAYTSFKNYKKLKAKESAPAIEE